MTPVLMPDDTQDLRSMGSPDGARTISSPQSRLLKAGMASVQAENLLFPLCRFPKRLLASGSISSMVLPPLCSVTFNAAFAELERQLRLKDKVFVAAIQS